MSDKYDNFVHALKVLCRQHRVALAPTDDGDVGVWDASESDLQVYQLEDCTDAPAAPRTATAPELPHCFMNVFAASQFPGYVACSRLSSRAESLAQDFHAADVVPVGSPTTGRSWAVIRRKAG